MEEQPRQRDADRSRAAILDAAERLFAADGFDAVTMAQIGAAAGVSRGTPGYFFGSKDALYGVVVQRAAATLRMLAQTLRVRDAAGTRDGTALIEDTVDAFLALLTARRSIVLLIDQSARAADGAAHALALRDALSGLGDGADEAALTILAMCWFPLANPDAARALGVDPDAPGFAPAWRTRVIAALGATPVTPTAPAARDAEPAADASPVEKKKKRKKKKG